jgi:hypothetical protein
MNDNNPSTSKINLDSVLPQISPTAIPIVPPVPTVGEIRFTLLEDGSIQVLTNLNDPQKTRNMGRLIYMVSTGVLSPEIVASLLTAASDITNLSTIQSIIEEWQLCKKQYKSNKLVVKPSEVLNKGYNK